jgi:dsRNA-specific ribonuclease
LDFNKIPVHDTEGWFENIFIAGPGFQMAQKFVEAIFEKHIDWTALIQNDDNYKNILQVKIQKEFKVTPHYMEREHDPDQGYKMGVYLCLGQAIHQVRCADAESIHSYRRVQDIQDTLARRGGKIFLFLGEGQHKIKRKAEQEACFQALQYLNVLLPHTSVASSHPSENL